MAAASQAKPSSATSTTLAAACHEWRLPPTHGSPLAIPEAILGATYNVGRQDATRPCQEITCTPHTSRTSAVGHVATIAVPCHRSAPGQSIPKPFAAYPTWLPPGHPRGPARQLRGPISFKILHPIPSHRSAAPSRPSAPTLRDKADRAARVQNPVLSRRDFTFLVPLVRRRRGSIGQSGPSCARL